MSLRPDINRSLLLVRYLFQLSKEQLSMPEPLCYSAILSSHDAIELFLDAVIAQNSINTSKSKKRLHLLEKWDIVNDTLNASKKFIERATIKRLNNSRNALKHLRTIPNKKELESYISILKNFFETNTITVFGIEFSEISLADSVRDEEVKLILKDAQKEINHGNYEKALEYITVSFHRLISNYEKNKKTEYNRSLFDFTERIDYYGEDSEIERTIDDISGSLTQIQNALKIICLDIDFRKYLKFRLITPKIILGKYVTPNQQTIKGIPYIPSKKLIKKVPKEDVMFCCNFVVNTAIRLQNFDFSFENIPGYLRLLK